MGQVCSFEGCGNRAIRGASNPVALADVFHSGPIDYAVPAYCGHHWSEWDCPGHVASDHDGKVCARCGIHVDSLRPPEEHKP